MRSSPRGLDVRVPQWVLEDERKGLALLPYVIEPGQEDLQPLGKRRCCCRVRVARGEGTRACKMFVHLRKRATCEEPSAHVHGHVLLCAAAVPPTCTATGSQMFPNAHNNNSVPRCVPDHEIAGCRLRSNASCAPQVSRAMLPYFPCASHCFLAILPCGRV